MSTNYWIEKYNKEVLLSEIEAYICKKYDNKFDPAQKGEISREIAEYLRKIGKFNKYNVYIGITQQDSNGYKLTIEIP